MTEYYQSSSDTAVNGLQAVGYMSQLHLFWILLGNVALAQQPHFAHPVYVPPLEAIPDITYKPIWRCGALVVTAGTLAGSYVLKKRMSPTRETTQSDAGFSTFSLPNHCKTLKLNRIGAFKATYDPETRLPNVMVVTEYYLKIKMYYPAPGISYQEDRNMTFDGYVSMPAMIRKSTAVLTLNMLNIEVEEVEVENVFRQRLNVLRTTYDEKKQQLSIILDKPLRAGSIVMISVTYSGHINRFTQGGLFYTYYYNNENQPVFMVATQLAPMDARRLFPCMDEPEYKASFYVELTYPTAHVALSNMKEYSSTEFGNGWSRVTFPPTETMSTYLLVFAVGPFVGHSVVNKDGTLVRSFGWTGQEDYLKFSAEAAAECLYQMGQITKIKFKMEKCDHLGLPELSFGAMENYGLVIYRHHYIAINFKTATTYDLLDAGRVICHEVSHQWFGNLVTTKWWDNLFVNEGFATYLQRIMTAKVFPQHAELAHSLAITGDLVPGLVFDASSKTHPLIAKGGPHFDRITYKKGGSLLRMLNDVLGEKVMWDGLSRYLAEHSEGTGTHEDVWKCLTEAAERAKITGYHGPLNVSDLMQSYAHETGFPLVHVHSDRVRAFMLSQEPFKNAKTKWVIPIRTASFQSSKPSQPRIEWLTPEDKNEVRYREAITAKARQRWVIASYAVMYGRIQYDDGALNSLLQRILNGDVPLGVKVMLISDEVALLERAKEMGKAYNYNRLLDVLTTVFNSANIQNDLHYVLIETALPQLEFFASVLRDTMDEPLIKAFYKKALEKAYNAKLWEKSASWDVSTFASSYLPVAVRYNIGDSVQNALRLFNEIVNDCKLKGSTNGTAWCTKVPTDFHRAIYCAAAKYDDNSGTNFNNLLTYYSQEVKTNPYFYQEYRALLFGLTCTEKQSLISNLVHNFLSSPLQPSLLFDLLKSNPTSSGALLTELKERTDQVLKYAGLSAYLDAMTYNWRSQKRLNEFVTLHKSLKQKLNPKQEELFTQYENRIKEYANWSREFMPSVMKWMYDHLVVIEKIPWPKRLSGNIKPQRYDVDIKPYIPGSAQYPPGKNLTFDGRVKITFEVTSKSDKIVLNCHRLLIDPEYITLKDKNAKIDIHTSQVSQEYDNALITIPTAQLMQPGMTYELTIRYSGFVFDGPHRGGVVSNHNYYEFNGKQGWIFSTDFENGPGARTLMPCADEPAYKAVVQMTVHHPANMKALSNMMRLKTTIEKNGWASTKFEESPPTSTYLIGICVGHFSSLSTVSKTGVLTSAYSWTGMEKYLEYSLMVMAGAVDFMSTYFDYPYPLKKLDMVALPQHANRGAMENWGLILGHYELLSADPDYVDIVKLSKVGNVVAHETVHMWFGDLVSIDWWSETFLKEGFAKYWAGNAHSYADSKQTNYTLDFNHFQIHRDALDFDCSSTYSKPMISETYPILGKIPYFKGSAMINMLSKVLKPETFQKGLRKFLKKRAFGTSNTEDLWESLTEVCAEDGVKDWQGRNLNVSKLMKEWCYEKSFPILKVSAKSEGQITYEQASCLGTNTTWTIPIIRGDGKSEKLLWFTGKHGNSQDWTPTLPFSSVDNIRGGSFIRIQYDSESWKDFLKIIPKLDHETQSVALSDAWFFTQKGVYSWPKFLDLVHALNWDNNLMQWSVGVSFMDTLYHRFRYHGEWAKIKEFLSNLGKKAYDRFGESSSIDWETQAFVAILQEQMCRAGLGACLTKATVDFSLFVRDCTYSRHGTGKCAGLLPNYRRSMYCYGLKQMPYKLGFLASLRKYFEEEAFYYDRDRDNLLRAMTCANLPRELSKQVNDAILGKLPEKIINYIGENDNTGQHILYAHVQKNLQEILWSDLDFGNYVEAMSMDWSTNEHLEKLTRFKNEEQYKLLNEEERRIWDKAIQKVYGNIDWITKNAKPILAWIKAHE